MKQKKYLRIVLIYHAYLLEHRVIIMKQNILVSYLIICRMTLPYPFLNKAKSNNKINLA